MAAIHQRGESVFKALRPEDVVWSPFAAFPAGAQLAVRVGDPAADGPYVVRVKVPHGVRLMPHRHPEDRIYTVRTVRRVRHAGHGHRTARPRIRRPCRRPPLASWLSWTTRPGRGTAVIDTDLLGSPVVDVRRSAVVLRVDADARIASARAGA
jgi:hypothetical protein